MRKGLSYWWEGLFQRWKGAAELCVCESVLFLVYLSVTCGDRLFDSVCHLFCHAMILHND